MQTDASQSTPIKMLLGPMRVPFLILTPACVTLGLASAVYSVGKVNPLYFILALIGAISAHISVNAFNEYFDFKSGLDTRTKRTPFSGGSGTLQAEPKASDMTLNLAYGTLAITAVIGIYFFFETGWEILPLGILGLLIIVAYTPWFAHSPFISLISPGLAFGTLMVMGTDFALTRSYSWAAFFASLVPFFLVNNLLLLNQFPDVEADITVGRRNYPIVIGRQKSSLIFGVFLFLADASILAGVLLGYLPLWSLLGLLNLILAIPVAIGAYQNANNIEKLIPILGQNVLINILTPILVAIGLFIG